MSGFATTFFIWPATVRFGGCVGRRINDLRSIAGLCALLVSALLLMLAIKTLALTIIPGITILITSIPIGLLIRSATFIPVLPIITIFLIIAVITTSTIIIL